ncbi:MAG TPA: DNA polymerase III subunit alpha, partial [Chloroflexota bacterium]|nr:DNA polymerase III subunit alpha [Chloroflexota bacterium]
INPIVGFEAYVSSGSRLDRSGGAFHLTLLAENETGYNNLMQLTTKAHLEGFYRKPRVDHELLELHREGVICLSGCASSEISRAILDRNLDAARDLIDWHRSIYGDRFYLELQDHGLDFQAELNRELINFSRSMGVPLVATNDVHYVRPEQSSAHEVLICVQTQTTMSDPKRMKMDSREFYLKSAEEMEKLFGDVDGAIKNSMAIAERCSLKLDFGQFQLLPQPPVPEGIEAKNHLRALCMAGLEHRYGSPATIPEAASERLEYELSVIEKTGYVDYMLLVNDFIQFGHKNGIAIGVRGSAGGSIVAYALRVTNVDPIALGLSFERFLNPERVSMPDIDIDIADDRRDELIRYVTQRFGRDHVAQIISFGTMAARAAIRDVGRATGVPLGSVDQVAKLIPFNQTLDQALDEVNDLKSIYEQDRVIHELVDMARELEGVARHASTHAAGIVMSAEPLSHHVPLYKVPKADAITTQYAMTPLDKLGLLKMDFLGLRTLTVVQRAGALVESTAGATIDLDDIPLDDPGIYQLLSRGETFGIFQVDGSGMRRLLRDMQPDRFDDIVALIALYRPGPMQFIDDFVRRRSGSSPVTYPHPALATALADTYGIVVYQEQVVRMVVEVAGFTMGQADLVRKAMAKKQPQLLAKYRHDFVEGAAAKGTAPDVADHLFDIIQEFSGYGFNKAHSAVYAVITCQTAYLKAHYPVQYMTAYLSAERENADKVTEALGECRRLKIPILPPDVNASLVDFSIEDGGIRFGLGAIRNVGSVAAGALVRERLENGQFVSVGDLCRRLDWQQVNKRTLESLIKCGALDHLGDRARLNFNLDRLVSYGMKSARDAASGQVSLFGEAEVDSLEPELAPHSDNDPTSWLRWEKEMIGAYLSHHPLEEAAEKLQRAGVRPLNEIDSDLEDQTVTVGGILSGVRSFATRKGDQMATAELNDLDGTIGLVVYPHVYRRHQDLVQNDAVVVVTGKVKVADGGAELAADSIVPLTDVALEVVPDEEPESYPDVPEPARRPLREPIPFPVKNKQNEDRATSSGQGRLIIDFYRTESRVDDLNIIKSIYQCLLKHPGRDRVTLVVHHGGSSRALQLPVDSIRLTAAVQQEIRQTSPGSRLTVVEALGA